MNSDFSLVGFFMDKFVKLKIAKEAKGSSRPSMKRKDKIAAGILTGSVVDEGAVAVSQQH